MTLPDERTSAVLQVRDFLARMLDPRQTPRLPSGYRRRARQLLKHYPTEYDLEMACRGKLDVFAPPVRLERRPRSSNTET